MNAVVVAPGFARSSGGIQAYSAALADAVVQLGHRCRMVEVSARAKISSIRAVVAAVGAPRPGVVLCTHVRVALPAVISARLARCPVWISLHGIEAWSVTRWQDRLAAIWCDATLPVSPWTRDRFLEQFPGRSLASDLLPNTFDPGLFRPGEPSAAVREVIAANHGRPVALIVARMNSAERYKGHETLIAAVPKVVERHPHFLLVVVGQGDDAPRLRHQAVSAGVARHVLFVGSVNDIELASWYRAADVLVLPSTGEGFGIVALEAAACGTPVLAAAEAGLGFVLETLGERCLGDPRSVGSCADALLDVFATLPESPFTTAARVERANAAFGPQRFQTTLDEILKKRLPCAR